ncbi:MAG: DNA polymerase III subunit alpha [Bacilli bacterium]|nr:DNA polymerase III subunit alpha [Bacilli bacterium]
MANRFEVHLHSEYSNIRIIDSINKVEKLVDRALELGLFGMALTDHEALCGHVKLIKYRDEIIKEHPDFKIALGNEIYLVDERPTDKHYHFILIAKDKVGYKQMKKLSSRAWLNMYSGKRVDTLKSDIEEIVGEEPGHIIATTACIGGELGSKILELEAARRVKDINTSEKIKQDIVNFVLWCKEIFGEDFYFEVAPAASKDQIIVNKKIAELSVVFGVKMIIGSDAHYLTKEDRFVHKAYLNSKEEEREVDMFYEYAYFQSEEDIIKNLTPSIVDLYEQMCANSMEIYNKIENYTILHAQVIPSVEVRDYPPVVAFELAKKHPILESMLCSFDKYERYWVNECFKKLQEKNLYNEEYLSRLEEEADIKRTIGEKLGTNMFSYPITLQHYIDMFWECGSTVGAGRGSSCSGLNHDLLGITQLDPIEWDLPFWRYMNKERIELGDIDIDIAPSKRPEILRRIREERGQHFNADIDPLSRKNLGATLVATFGTETSKSAILTACRGYRSEDCPNGIDVDTAQYLSSLVPVERGFVWDLHTVVYGDIDKDRKPIQPFINEVNEYPGLLDIMFGIEGLISRRGSHASGVIFQDEDPYEFGCFMRTPSGEVITQWDLHDAEAAGMTKYDFLVTSVQDKIVQTINFLQEYGEIEKNLSLREVYDKYLHPSVLPIDDLNVWKNIQNVSVLDLFQFDSESGSQAAKKIKPTSMYELSDANGLMRLMTAEKGAELPMDKYVRFKNNHQLWYDEMDSYGLTKEEQQILRPHFIKSHGVPPSQEQMMTMLMDENICGFSLKDANTARKIVGKKQMSKIPELKEKVLSQAASPALGKYVWDCGIGPQMGYSFSVIHALAYSFIGFQTAYLATRWNPLYWNTACLIVNSESLEEEEEEIVDVYEKENEDYSYTDLPDRKGKKKVKTANYEKIAKAIGDMQARGIGVSLVDINKSGYTFKPDIKSNKILYGLKPLSRVNDEIISTIIAGRPYTGIKDFMARCPLQKTVMINLIKAGAFDSIEKDFKTRQEIMCYYLMNNADLKKKITLQNFNGLIQKDMDDIGRPTFKLIPDSLSKEIRIFNFNKYLKTKKFILDNSCIEFLNKFLQDEDLLISNDNNVFTLDAKCWDKVYQKYMDNVRAWIKENQESILKRYNYILFKEVWDKYALGSLSKWEMDSLCFYYHEHELANVNVNKYGIVDFFKQPTQPQVDYYFKRNGHDIPIFKLNKIIGTVIGKNDSHHMITLLTTTGIVTVKFTGEYYSMFKKQISRVNPDGTKKVLEKGWFTRGTKLMVQGYRVDDQWRAKNYKSSGMHQLYKIVDVVDDDIIIQHERQTGIFEEEDNGEY